LENPAGVYSTYFNEQQIPQAQQQQQTIQDIFEMPQSAAIQEKLRQFEQNSKSHSVNPNGTRLYNKSNLTTSNGQTDALPSSTMVQNLKSSYQNKPQRVDETADYLTMHRADLIDEVKAARGLIEENRVSLFLFYLK